MFHSRTFASLLAIGALGFALVAHAGFNHWTFQGPVAGGGSVSAIAAHPTDATIALAATARGIFRTNNKGANWTQVKNDLAYAPLAILFDPANPNRVIVADGSLYISNDAGLTFTSLPRPPNTTYVRQIAFSSTGRFYAMADSGRVFAADVSLLNWAELTTPWTSGSPQFITVDPGNPQHIYVGMYGQGVYRTMDSGDHWQLLTGSFPDPSIIGYYGVAIDPADWRRLFVATTYGVHQSDDAGFSWSLVHNKTAQWIGINPANPTSVYVSGYNGIYRGNFNGAWTQLNLLHMASIPNLAFVAGSTRDAYAATSNGVFFTDEANTWFSVQFKSIGITGASPSNLAATHDTVYATMAVEWSDLFKRVGSNYVATHDFFDQLLVTDSHGIYSLGVAPGDSNQIYLINLSKELFRSADGGKHWSGPHTGFGPIDPLDADYLNDVVIDPHNAQVAYVARKLTGVWKTTDGGTTFTPLAGSPPDVLEIGVSPHSSAVLYAVTGNGNNHTGISKSVDGGATWVVQMAALNSPDRYFTRFTFHPTDPDVVYLPASYDGLYRTTNGGGTWSRVSLPQPSGPLWWAETVLIDPAKPTTLWVVNGVQTGFWRSVDNGVSWNTTGMPSIPGPQTNLSQAVLDPDDPTILLAAASNVGIADYQVMPDLAVTLTSEPLTPLAVATTVNAIFRVSNVGVHASSSADLDVDVPAWLTPSATGCTFTAPRLHCPLGALLVGASRDINVTLVVGSAPQAGGAVTGRVSGYEQDIDLTNNLYGFNADSQERANLAVAIAANATSFDRGTTTNVTVTASNSGPSPSTATQLTLHLPSNISASQVTNGHGSCTQNGSDITCSLGTLAVNGNASITLVLAGNAVGPGTLNAEIDGAGVDPDGIFTASRDFYVRPATDLSVTIEESADPVTVREPFWYYVRIRNNGPDLVALHLGVVVNSATPDSPNADFAATCSVSGNNVACDGYSLAAGATGTITIRNFGNLPGIATATATVTTDATDTDVTNNSATIGTTQRLVGDVSAEMVVIQGPVSAVGQITFTATVRNAGPSAGGVHVVIPLTNATVVAVTSSAACTHTSTSATCDIASLGMGSSADITVTAAGIAAGTASATATATFAGVDPDPANNSATAQTTVQIAADTADLAVELSESTDPVVVGGTLTYTAAVRNLGPNTGAAHLVVTLTGGTVRGVSPPASATCGNTPTVVSCDFGTVANAAAATFTIEVNTTAAGTASASATIGYGGADPVSSNNSASITTTVNAAPSSSSSSGGGSSGGGSSSGGGGGGGGRFDWLALGLLGLLLASRGWLPASARR
jgi:uncharacterized membrane protein YgcG